MHKLGAVLSLEFKRFVERHAEYQVWHFPSGSGFGQAGQIRVRQCAQKRWVRNTV